MDSEFWLMLLKIILALPFLLALIYLSLKYGGSKLQHIQNGRFIKVLERVALSKENSLLVVRIGEKGYVMSSTNNSIQILSEVSSEELSKIEESKIIPQYSSLKEFYEKVIKKKEDNNE